MTSVTAIATLRVLGVFTNTTGRLMETILSLSGILGAVCCVAMYAAVSVGKISAERPAFFIVNAVGAVLVLVGASQEFDLGDAGTIGQELIWAAISLAGAARAWLRQGGADKIRAWREQLAASASARPLA